ncbi:MAG: RsmE family RNA methyltransferase [Bryobacteraceae bacterium]|jgi:16S rRNA (uracil1498-N3)-methyltransferase
MARRRFFVDAVRDSRAVLAGEDARHLRQVLRAEIGQRFELSDNRSVYMAEVESLAKDRVSFRVLEELAVAPPPVRLTLLLALIKFDRFEWALEKATELGVETVLPVQAERSERGLDRAAAKRLDRWRKIVRQSSQQARRARLPEVLPPAPLGEALAGASSYSCFLEERSDARPILAALPSRRQLSDRVRLLVGPEGGWTDAERARVRQAGWTPVSLGPTILRTETAAIAALAVVSAAWLESASVDSPLSRPLS